MPLTATAIHKAKPREKPRKLYDSRGLYLEIAPRGTKAWRFKYRFAGREKRISMGIYPEVSLKLARQRRDEARKLLARDIDPSAYRKAQKRSRRQWARNSFEAVASEWLAKHSPNWSTGWVRRLESELGRDVFPYIGASPVAELTAPDLLAVVRRVEARGHLRKAHTILQTCGASAALRGGDGPGRAGTCRRTCAGRCRPSERSTSRRSPTRWRSVRCSGSWTGTPGRFPFAARSVSRR